MKNETYEKLFKRSYKREDRLVTPLILDYFTLMMKGFDDETIISEMERSYNSEKK